MQTGDPTDSASGGGGASAAPPDTAIEPQPLPPAPPTMAPEQPAAVEMVRHPTLDAPDQVISGQEFTVSVALTEDQVTPDVTVRAGPESSVTPEGALEFSMPGSAAGVADRHRPAGRRFRPDGWRRLEPARHAVQGRRQRLRPLHPESARGPRRFQAAAADRQALSRRTFPWLGVAAGDRVPRPGRRWTDGRTAAAATTADGSPAVAAETLAGADDGHQHRRRSRGRSRSRRDDPSIPIRTSSATG